MEEREFEVSGKVWVSWDDVCAFCDIDPDEPEREPTDAEWLKCAYELFENDEIYWSESSLEPC